MPVDVINNGGKIDSTVKLIGSGKLILGKKSEIRAYSVLEFGNGTLTLGENSVIGYSSMLQLTGDIKIGKGSLLGPHCVLLASSHPINEKSLVGQGLIRGTVDIGNNVWFGANCTVGYNVTVHNGSIIGANSFVNKDVPANQIWAGSPIKKIRDK